MKIFSMFFKALHMASRFESTPYKTDSVDSTTLIDELCADQYSELASPSASMADYPEDSLARLA